MCLSDAEYKKYWGSHPTAQKVYAEFYPYFANMACSSALDDKANKDVLIPQNLIEPLENIQEKLRENKGVLSVEVRQKLEIARKKIRDYCKENFNRLYGVLTNEEEVISTNFSDTLALLKQYGKEILVDKTALDLALADIDDPRVKDPLQGMMDGECPIGKLYDLKDKAVVFNAESIAEAFSDAQDLSADQKKVQHVLAKQFILAMKKQAKNQMEFEKAKGLLQNVDGLHDKQLQNLNPDGKNTIEEIMEEVGAPSASMLGRFNCLDELHALNSCIKISAKDVLAAVTKTFRNASPDAKKE